MKKRLLAFSMITFSVLVITSCKKNDDATPTLSGQWTYVKDIEWDTHNSTGITSKDTTTYTPDSYINFANDGKVYSKYNYNGTTQYDTIGYTISGSTLILLPNVSVPYSDTIQIQSLADHNVTLYASDHYPGGFYQLWQYLAR